MKRIIFLILMIASTGAMAQEATKWQGKFEQLDQLLPTPNEYRS